MTFYNDVKNVLAQILSNSTIVLIFRRGTADQWTTANPILRSGEPGYETDTKKEKRGDGVTAWVGLPYFSDTVASQIPLAPHANTHAAGGNDPVTLTQNQITGLVTTLQAKADLVGGTIPSSQIASLQTHETISVTNRSAMLALTTTQVQPGDVAVIGQTGAKADQGLWLLTSGNPSLIASWLHLDLAVSGVSSVNAQTGDVVLSAANVGADPSGAASAMSINVQVFTANATWTKPAGAKYVKSKALSGGGGGGSGARQAAGVLATGGSGGGGGSYTERTYLASDLPPTVPIVVGNAGHGASSATVDSTNGTAGTAGSASIFGAAAATYFGGANGAGAGQAGTAAGSAAGGLAGSGGTANGSAGGASAAAGTVGSAGGTTVGGGAGGGAGGGITVANVAAASGAGGTTAGSTNGPVSATTGVTGGSGYAFPLSLGGPGTGAAGGGASTTAAGGAGGIGGIYGGGGGGGGASRNGFNSGAGGDGGPGLVIVETYF